MSVWESSYPSYWIGSIFFVIWFFMASVISLCLWVSFGAGSPHTALVVFSREWNTLLVLLHRHLLKTLPKQHLPLVNHLSFKTPNISKHRRLVYFLTCKLCTGVGFFLGYFFPLSIPSRCECVWNWCMHLALASAVDLRRPWNEVCGWLVLRLWRTCIGKVYIVCIIAVCDIHIAHIHTTKTIRYHHRKVFVKMCLSANIFQQFPVVSCLQTINELKKKWTNKRATWCLPGESWWF